MNVKALDRVTTAYCYYKKKGTVLEIIPNSHATRESRKNLVCRVKLDSGPVVLRRIYELDKA